MSGLGMRTLRLFSILDELRVHRRPVSAQTMADKLGVSVRTIYRDMATLQQMGAPVRGEGGIGYQIEKGYFLPPLHFDEDELDAVILGMRLVAAKGDGPLADAALRASAKINAVLSEHDREAYSGSPLLAYSEQEEEADDALRFLSPLRRAIRDRQYLQITYMDLKQSRSQRSVRPLGLTAFSRVWLLTAWCELRQDFRNFRVDRLQEGQPMVDRRVSGFGEWSSNGNMEVRTVSSALDVLGRVTSSNTIISRVDCQEDWEILTSGPGTVTETTSRARLMSDRKVQTESEIVETSGNSVTEISWKATSRADYSTDYEMAFVAGDWDYHGAGTDNGDGTGVRDWNALDTSYQYAGNMEFHFDGSLTHNYTVDAADLPVAMISYDESYGGMRVGTWSFWNQDEQRWDVCDYRVDATSCVVECPGALPSDC